MESTLTANQWFIKTNAKQPRQVGFTADVKIERVNNGLYLTIAGEKFVATDDQQALHIIKHKLQLIDQSF